MASEKTATKAGAPTYRLRLFVADGEANSAKARIVLARLCEKHLKGRYELHVVDVLQDYQAALADQVIAVPTLIVDTPTGRTVLVGSLSDEEKVLVAFNVSSNGEVRP